MIPASAWDNFVGESAWHRARLINAEPDGSFSNVAQHQRALWRSHSQFARLLAALMSGIDYASKIVRAGAVSFGEGGIAEDVGVFLGIGISSIRFHKLPVVARTGVSTKLI